MQNIYPLVRLNSLVQNHRVKFAAVAVANALRVRHLAVRLDPVMGCNLSCQMCASSNPEYREANRGAFSVEELKRLGDMFFPLALQVVVGNSAEPTVHREFASVVRLAKQHGVPSVSLASNGQLLTESKLGELIGYGLDEIVISLHGVRQHTYERLMVGASYERFLRVLDSIASWRARSSRAKPFFRLNYTVCPDNLEELRDFFAVFGSYSIDALQIRPFFDMGGTYGHVGLESCLPRYNEVVSELVAECRKRRVTCLANTSDPKFEDDGYAGVILQAIRRDVRPGYVWRSDFDWRHLTYAEFCRSIGWGRELVRLALMSRSEVVKDTEFAHALRYNVS